MPSPFDTAPASLPPSYKKLTPAELQPGDVLLFTPEYTSALSWAICLLTDAPASHAALFYGRSETSRTCKNLPIAHAFIEEGDDDLAIQDALDPKKGFKTRDITIRRLPVATLTPALQKAIIAAADAHYANADPYNMAGLLHLGTAIITSRLERDGKLSDVMAKTLRACSALIAALWNQNKHPDKTPMTCSQFVAQCHDEAGIPLVRLPPLLFTQPSPASHIANASPADAVLQTLALPALSTTDRLHYQRILCTGAVRCSRTRTPLKYFRNAAALRKTLETLARKLTALVTARAIAPSTARGNFAAPTSAQTRALNTEVLRFASLQMHLNGVPPLEATLAPAPRANFLTHLQDFWQRRNLLVTPADLLYCDTLETIGYVKLPNCS